MENLDNKRIEIYENKFKELRDQVNDVQDDLVRIKKHLTQIAYGYLTPDQKSDLAKSAIKIINERS